MILLFSDQGLCVQSTIQLPKMLLALLIVVEMGLCAYILLIIFYFYIQSFLTLTSAPLLLTLILSIGEGSGVMVLEVSWNTILNLTTLCFSFTSFILLFD